MTDPLLKNQQNTDHTGTSDEHASVAAAIAAYRAGGMVIIVDDDDRENEGDLAMAAEYVTPDAINFMATYGKGLICLPMRAAMIDRLQIPMMVPDQHNRSGFGTGFTISVEATEGVSTGISAFDRSHTIKTLIDPATTPNDIAMPGHVFPLRARDGGVLERRGQTEASVDLAVLAGLVPAGVICEVMSADGTMALMPELQIFSKEHDIPIVSVEELASYRQELESADDVTENNTAESVTVSLIGKSQLPTVHGDFEVMVFRDAQGLEHSALVTGDLATANKNKPAPLVRLHSECLTGDAFGSQRCDCGQQLQTALQQIAQEGTGVLLYLRQEGRGIGLGNKIRAYELQDKGLDTVDANLQLGFPADGRHYDVAAAILTEIGTDAIRLITNNPAKRESLQKLGIRVNEQLPLVIAPQSHNRDYLQTKALRMGHALPAHSRELGEVQVDNANQHD